MAPGSLPCFGPVWTFLFNIRSIVPGPVLVNRLLNPLEKVIRSGVSEWTNKLLSTKVFLKVIDFSKNFTLFCRSGSDSPMDLLLLGNDNLCRFPYSIFSKKNAKEYGEEMFLHTDHTVYDSKSTCRRHISSWPPPDPLDPGDSRQCASQSHANWHYQQTRRCVTDPNLNGER